MSNLRPEVKRKIEELAEVWDDSHPDLNASVYYSRGATAFAEQAEKLSEALEEVMKPRKAPVTFKEREKQLNFAKKALSDYEAFIGGE